MSLLQEHQPTFPPRLVSSPPRQAADWMGALPSHLRLDALTIPGTHDSGATRGGTRVTCQEMTIAEQLAAGVRHLDIRVRLHGGRFGVHHGRWHRHHPRRRARRLPRLPRRAPHRDGAVEPQAGVPPPGDRRRGQ